MQQIKVWDECTYSMEIVRINLMQLKENTFEKIDTNRAISFCQKSLEQYPNDPHIKFLLARAYTKAKQYKKGFALASESCKQGDIGGCTLLGGYFDSRLIDKKNIQQKSILLWVWACSQGGSQACTNLYTKSHYNTFMLKEIINKDSKLLDICKQGDYPSACYLYAKNCFARRKHSDECYDASLRSCISGNSEGCLFYNEFTKNKSNKLSNTQQLLSVYQKSCNNGNVESCLQVAHIYGSKERNKVNNVMALSLYEDSCVKGHSATACRYAGAYYLGKLEGVTQNIPKGISYLETSCKPRTTRIETAHGVRTNVDYDIRGCLDLAKYYIYTPQKKYQNIKKAKQILQQACNISSYYYTSNLGCQLGIDTCCQHMKHYNK